MNVSPTPELGRRIHQKVESGLYLSASEVVREAMRLLDGRDRMQALKWEGRGEEIRIGLDQASRGEVAPLDVPATFAKVRERRKDLRGRPDASRRPD